MVEYASREEQEQAQLDRKQRIWQVIAAIPKGRVCSYGGIAKLAGLGNGARQTAWALRYLPRDTKIPWHRVINAQGKISMPVGSRGYREQRKRLKSEGVTFNESGRLASKTFWWQGD
jgi:methylated-DNA-protein-cysteine methyltransferase-like protein